MITIALTGDVMLGRMANWVLHYRGAAYPWGDTLPLLRAADLTLMNLECVTTLDGRPWARWPKVFHFRADPVAIEALLEAGTDCVFLANNHTLDYEYEGLLDMLARLDGAGIAHAGAGRNLAEASSPAILEAGGIRLGVLAFTDNEPDWAAFDDRPGVNYLPVSTELGEFHVMQQSIAAARVLGSDLVLVSNHWGPNMQPWPSTDFQQFARATIDAGADLYLGHSAHVLQGIEIYRGKPIFYDAGDFVDDYAVDPELRNDRSALILCDLGASGVEAVRLLPTLISDCQVNLARDDDFEAIATQLRRLSAEFGTHLEVHGTAIEVEVSPARSSR